MSGLEQRVAVLGIGRVGLPLALYLADRGHDVVGIDVNPEHIRQLEQGEMPFLEQGAPEALARTLGRRFHPTLGHDRVPECQVLILTLGTPVDEHLNPDFSAVEHVLSSLRPHLRPGQLLILRSTVTPGTTEFVRRRLEETTPLRVGQDFFLAFCPERIAQGNTFAEMPEIPQIVGADDEGSRERARAFFRDLTGELLATDTRSAEIAKLFCNVYRYIDFAIGNEFMMIADQFDRDIYELTRLVNRGYRRGGLKAPGFTGGPCLYKDGFFLVDRTPFPDLLTTAWKINESVPNYLIDVARKRLGGLSDRTVLILGLSFKRDIDDNRNSLAYKAMKTLHRHGARILTHDPFLAPGDLPALLAEADLALVATNHACYQELGREALRAAAPLLVADIWNVFGTGKVFFEA